MAAGECAGRLPSHRTGGAESLDAARCNDGQLHDPRRRGETLDRLRDEVEELRASRTLVLAADADRRVHRARAARRRPPAPGRARGRPAAREPALDADPAAAKALLASWAYVQQALDETAQLAQRIYPPLLEAGGLAAALRAAAARAGVRASLEIAAGTHAPARDRGGGLLVLSRGARAAGGERRADRDRLDEDGAVAFEVDRGWRPSDAGLDRLRDRVEALGGRLTISIGARRRHPHLRLAAARRNDARRSPTGRGRRPSRAWGPPVSQLSPSLRKIEWITFSTDRSVRNSASAIAALFFPSAISRSTSRSRGVNWLSGDSSLRAFSATNASTTFGVDHRPALGYGAIAASSCSTIRSRVP